MHPGVMHPADLGFFVLLHAPMCPLICSLPHPPQLPTPTLAANDIRLQSSRPQWPTRSPTCSRLRAARSC